MSTAETSAAPPSELNLASPQETDTFTGTFTPFMQQAIPTNFNLHLPTSKTPRNPSRIRPFQGGEDDSAGVSFDSSPGRRGRHYHLQHGGGESSMTAATPRSSMAFVSGISQSADPTPIRFNQQSSPSSARNVLRGVIVPGDDMDYGSWDITPARDYNEDGLVDNDRTPMPSPTVARAGSKRTLSGLGSSPMRTAKRSRYATMGPTSNPPSVPPSPLRKRTTSSSGGLMTNMPLERSASTSLAPPSGYSSQSRIVSNVSMISSVSTELISPALSPTYGSFSQFPTSMSAPDMMGSLSSYSNHSTPHMAPAQPPTIAPRDIMGNNSSYQPIPPTSLYTSPEMVDGDMSTLSHPIQMPMLQSTTSSPSISSSATSHIPTFPYHAERNMTLETIHEQEGQVALVTPGTPQGPQFDFGDEYSVGMASIPVMIDTTAEYPVPPGYSTYQAPSPRPQEVQGQDWQQHQYYQPSHPTAPLQYQIHQPPTNEHGTSTHYWQPSAVGPGAEQYHPQPHHQHLHQQQHQHHQHMGMSRAASATYSHEQPSTGYMYQQQPSYGPTGSHGHPSPHPYASSAHPHPHFSRSASTGTISTMPSMSQIPTGGNTHGLFVMPDSGPSSAPMTSSSSLPMHPHPALQQDHVVSPTDTLWNTAAGPSRTQPTRHHYESASGSGSIQRSVPSSPATPSKKRHPTVGKRLRPGPKPRGTPKKGRQTSGSSTYIPSSSGVEDEGTTSEIPSCQVTSPEFTHAAPPPRSAPVLELGGPLSAAVAPLPPPPPSAPSRASSSQPRRGSAAAVKLALAPPTRTHTPEGLQVAGLPKDFIDKLYTTYMTMEGSTTGQPAKRFKCLIEGCERSFPRKSAISSHIQTHLDDKPFVCGEIECQASFVRQHDLRRHMRIHTGTKPFPCPCGKGFARGDALMRHRQRNICNGGLPPDVVEEVQ